MLSIWMVNIPALDCWQDYLNLINCYCVLTDSRIVISFPIAFFHVNMLCTLCKSLDIILGPENWKYRNCAFRRISISFLKISSCIQQKSFTFSNSNRCIRRTCKAFIIYKQKKKIFSYENAETKNRFIFKIQLTNPSSSALLVSNGRFSFSNNCTNAWMSLEKLSPSQLFPFDDPFGLDDDVFDGT